MVSEIKKVYVHLEPDEEDRVRYYLDRTTILWNITLEHIGDLADVYFDAPDSPDSDQEFSGVVDMIHRIVIKNDGELMPGFKLNDRHKPAVKNINELPEEIIQFRLFDMKRCFHSVKKRRLENPNEEIKAPAKKHSRSKKSCRFGRDNFQLSPDGHLVIQTEGNSLSIRDNAFMMDKPDSVKMVTVSTAMLSAKQREHLGLELGIKYHCFTFFFS